MNEFQVRTIAKEEANKLGCQVSCLVVIFGFMFIFILVGLAIIEPDIVTLTFEAFRLSLPFK
jgi:hypothetical protein